MVKRSSRKLNLNFHCCTPCRLRREGSDLNRRDLGRQPLGPWEPSRPWKSEIQGIELDEETVQRICPLAGMLSAKRASLICKHISQPAVEGDARISKEQGT